MTTDEDFDYSDCPMGVAVPEGTVLPDIAAERQELCLGCLHRSMAQIEHTCDFDLYNE